MLLKSLKLKGQKSVTNCCDCALHSVLNPTVLKFEFLQLKVLGLNSNFKQTKRDFKGELSRKTD